MTDPICCRYCGLLNTKRFGTYKDTQLWWCNICKRKFRESTALFKMKTPVEQVSAALDMYYGGLPLDSIQRNIEQQYGNRLSESAIYYWVIRFSKEAVEKSKDYKPDVGDVWIADETVVKIGGRNVWFWDIIDRDSRYLLASHISLTRTTKDAQILMQEAYEVTGKVPKKILTDKLRAYLDGIELTFGSDTKHVQTSPFKGGDETTNIIERFHGTLKERTKIIRWFGNLETAKILTDAWLVHYNFFKEHTTLGDVPPAQKMSSKVPFTSWAGVVKGTQAQLAVFRPKAKHKIVHDLTRHRHIPKRKPESLRTKQYYQAEVSTSRSK